MSEEKGKRVYCTNMQDDDPIVETYYVRIFTGI